MTLRLGVLVSGAGTNLQAILDAIERKALAAEVAVVISNVPGVPALERARAAEVPAVSLDHRAHESREAFENALVSVLRDHDVEWVILAGFMRVLSPHTVAVFRNRILNMHPALLPSFPGLRAPAQALAEGVKVAGCTVHIVDEGTDTGPILAQAAVPVLADDDVASLTRRVQAQERLLYPRVIQWIAEGRLSWHNGRPMLRDIPEREDAITSPPLAHRRAGEEEDEG